MNLVEQRQYLVPQEMMVYPHWVCWGRDMTNDKQPWSPVTGLLASPIQGSDWGTYRLACDYATAHNFKGIGFVVSQYDPFAFIDLDDPKGDADITSYQQSIFSTFPSYAEISPSGQGLHIIVKGDLPRGRRRGKVEIYSQGRYMTMSGNPYRNVNILSCQEELLKLYKNLGGGREAVQIMDGDFKEVEADETIIHRASGAANGEKFSNLYGGYWEQYYESQSQADFAIIDILAFYTQSKKQIIRIFHSSELGQRTKAKRQDYLDYMLGRCFDKLLPAIDLSYLRNEIEIKIAEMNLQIENEIEPTEDEDDDIFAPPSGMLGDIAKYIYDQAPRPVREIALAGALGLMSGIVGRSYNVSSTGLNQYYLLLAPTGTGKESMTSGIDKLMEEVSKLAQNSMDFIGPGEIASPQALVRYLNDDSVSFVSVLGEFALVMKNMTSQNAPSHLVGLKRILLDLYNKSGQGKVLRPTVRSDRAKNTNKIKSPAMTLLGESTPERFYEILDDSMISEGLLPRFLNIEYSGERPPLNYNHANVKPSQGLVESLAALCAQSSTLNASDKVVHVGFCDSANELLHDFDKFCDRQINSTKTEIRKHLWNRAHLKVLKLAALMAIGKNTNRPVIDLECALWAKNIVERDCLNIIQRFDSGNVGSNTNETTQLIVLTNAILDFTVKPMFELPKSSIDVKNCKLYHANKVIPYSYLMKRLVGKKQFKLDRQGPTKAIKASIRTLIDTGEISELGIPERKSMFGTITACYIIENENLFSDMKRRVEI